MEKYKPKFKSGDVIESIFHRYIVLFITSAGLYKLFDIPTKRIVYRDIGGMFGIDKNCVRKSNLDLKVFNLLYGDKLDEGT